VKKVKEKVYCKDCLHIDKRGDACSLQFQTEKLNPYNGVWERYKAENRWGLDSNSLGECKLYEKR